jgi:hypothetical protein
MQLRNAHRTTHRRLSGRAALSLAAAGSLVAALLVSGGPASATPVAGLTNVKISVGAQTAIPANSAGVSQAAYAFCRPGQVVISGGVINHNPNVFIRSSYADADTQWLSVVTPSVNVSYPEWFQTYVICADASSVPGYHRINTAQLPVGPATYYGPNKAVGDAYCGSNEVVLGGGVRSHNPSTWVTVSRPTTDNQAWEVEVNLTNPPSWGGEYYQVYAVCAPSTDLSSYTISSNVGGYGTGLTTAQHTNAAGTPYCGAGLVAIAAGATNHDQDHGFISSLSPTAGDHYWVVNDTNINPPSYGESFVPIAACVSGTLAP